MNAAEIILLVLMGGDLLLASHQHGKPRDENYNFWVTLLTKAVLFLLLYWAGLFH